MHFSLVQIGAHDGSSIEEHAGKLATQGKVLLVEPVPWLFRRLAGRFKHVDNVILLNEAISELNGDVEFYMPKESTYDKDSYVDQLGSLNPGHAIAHGADLSDKIEKITCRSRTIDMLVSGFQIGSIDRLITDTEGYDARILLKFPFDRVMPKNIIFEHKHADGPFHMGKHFAALLVLLDNLKYRVRVLDGENCVAVLAG